MNKLFVYGIFLDERNRAHYGMSNPQYDVVAGFLTMGAHIVQAVPIPERPDIALTGLVVDVDPSYWGRIDRLEGAYDRVTITTVNSVQAYIYVGKGEHENIRQWRAQSGHYQSSY